MDNIHWLWENLCSIKVNKIRNGRCVSEIVGIKTWHKAQMVGWLNVFPNCKENFSLGQTTLKLV